MLKFWTVELNFLNQFDLEFSIFSPKTYKDEKNQISLFFNNHKFNSVWDFEHLFVCNSVLGFWVRVSILFWFAYVFNQTDMAQNWFNVNYSLKASTNFIIFFIRFCRSLTKIDPYYQSMNMPSETISRLSPGNLFLNFQKYPRIRLNVELFQFNFFLSFSTSFFSFSHQTNQ